ncbi:MAG: UDP-N-acetylmuramoyl-L-alanine--D-glutamate ligase [Steroidobacteraceae bacterium]|jgi:UDP-N-acetylmuramoylalanine--D-glutamate ligase|nr:UDP-N-acetylmuramoyl-L-alanine--D-glutamate ligase [Steroidobacteraceae bacterium]
MAGAPERSAAAVQPGRRNLVVGLGKTGLSCVRWLTRQGERVAVTDSRANPPGLDQLRAEGLPAGGTFGAFDLRLLDAADRVVLSPGVSRREPLVQGALARGLDVVGDVELFARVVRAPVVGITGTNGKSTVTTLVAEMARRAGRAVLAGGNLGEPALDLLAQPVPELYVLELSSYQLESTDSLALVAAAVLNLTPDHMDRYDSMADYGAAKARIYAHAGVAVVNADDDHVRPMPSRYGRDRVVAFSLEGRPAAWQLVRHGGREWLARDGERRLATDETKLPGRHNAANSLAALALGEACGLERAPMLEVLREFTGLPHRMQWVADVRGVRYVDDSKGTNVGATLAAVAGLDGPLVIVAGGDGKGQDFAPLADAFKGKVRHAVLIGQDREAVANALAGACTTEFAADMDAAVAAAAGVAQPGDLVLLSPACASLDMFRDYSHRGRAFADAVRRLEP